MGNSYQQVLGSYPNVGSSLSRVGRAEFGAAGRMAGRVAPMVTPARGLRDEDEPVADPVLNGWVVGARGFEAEVTSEPVCRST